MRPPAALVALIAAALVVTAAAVPREGSIAPRAEEDPGAWVAPLRSGRAALMRGDLAEARVQLERVDSIVGGHAGAMGVLASIAARQGDTARAVRWLRDLAATGLTRRVGTDTTFAAIAGDPDFRMLAAKLDSNGAVRANARRIASLGDAALLAEDVAWDARRRRFLVTSIHQRRIVAVGADGRVTDFVRAGADGGWGFYGIALDAKRGRAWATTAAGAESEGYAAADSGRTALVAFDLASGRPIERVELPRNGGRHVLGDLTLGPDGVVYLTDSVGGGVYRLRPGHATFDTLAAGGTFQSPQMPVLWNRDRLLIPDYPRGLAALIPSTGAIAWLAKPRTLASGGIDGLYRDGDRLIAVQNGTTPHRVIGMRLDAAATRILEWWVLEQASPDLGEPNHGVIVGRDFCFIGNSGWDRVNAREELQTPDGAAPPVLMRLSLDRGR